MGYSCSKNYSLVGWNQPMLHFHLVFCHSRLDQMEFSWFCHQLRWHQPILHFHCFFGQPRPDHIYVRLAGASNSRWFGGKEAARSEATPWVNPSTYNACSPPVMMVMTSLSLVEWEYHNTHIALTEIIWFN